jgi:MFS family permease
VLIAAIGLAGCFAFQTACMLLATVLTLPLAPDRKRTHGSMARSALQNVMDGIRFLATEPILRACTLIAALHNLLAMAYSSLMPVFAADVFIVGAAGLGAMMAAAGVGSVLGALATTALSHHKRKGAIMFGAAIALGAVTIGFAVVPSVPPAMAALAWIGGLSTVAMATCQTILNLALPDEFRGRVMSIYMMTWSLPQLTAPPVGWFADQVGAPAAVAGSGALFLASMVLAAVWLSSLRRFTDDEFVRGRRERAPAA